MTNGIITWAIDLMESLGSAGAGIAIAAENLFPPLPSELILPLAGFTAAQGKLGLIEVLIWTTAGSMAGAIVLYALGALLGRRRMYAIATRIPLIKSADVAKAEQLFERHGRKAVFFGRMVPIFRSFISIPAGIERMALLPFILLTALGSAIWNTAFVLAGYQLGKQWWRVEQYANIFQNIVIVVVVVAIAALIVLGITRNRRERHQHVAQGVPQEPR